MRTIKLTLPDAWRQMPPAYPHPLHRWLTDRGSLTARIVDHYPQFNLVRLAQRLDTAHIDERAALGLRRGELAVVREVLLRNADMPLVFAHSVARPLDLRSAWRGLSRLGARPLAEMLFHDPLVARLPMEYRKIDRRHPLYRRACEVAIITAPQLWARRSMFIKQGCPLIVTEVFLHSLRNSGE